MRRVLALSVLALAGFAAGCDSDNEPNKISPTIDQPPPQPTVSTQKTGTPSTPANTGRTTTASAGD